MKQRIEEFDFKQVDWFDAAKLEKDKACGPVLVSWFDQDPGPFKRGVVPKEIDASESEYIRQLLSIYEERGPGTFPSAKAAMQSDEFRDHLRDQRSRFFDAVFFDRFYRVSTPRDYLETFKDEVYHGVMETHGDQHSDRLIRHSKVMQQAAVLQPSGVLGNHAGPKVKQGTCHQFARSDMAVTSGAKQFEACPLRPSCTQSSCRLWSCSHLRQCRESTPSTWRRRSQ